MNPTLENNFTHMLSRRPEAILMGVGVFSLLVFLSTIPLPRIDNQLVGSDGIPYYVYLPSLLLDRDLDFADEFTYFYAFEPGHAERLIRNPTPRGLPANQWPIGPAVFWAPFFLAAHLLAYVLKLFGAGISVDGYGTIYQAFALSGSIAYGSFGLVLTYWFVSEAAEKRAALLATLLVTLGGNLVYYMTAEPSMAHAISAFTSGLFFCVWMRRRQRPGVKTALLLGLIGGAMALVRLQAGLFLALPFFARLPDAWRSLKHRETGDDWRGWLRDILLSALTALAVFSPQMVVWGQLYGNYVRSPYLYQEHPTLVYWLSPKLGAVLFSAFRGLFVWHPIFFLALVGMSLVYRKDRVLGAVGFLAAAIQWYVISSWHSWVQGDAFGGRMFIVCTPVFVLGLAHLIEWAHRRWSWSAVYTIGGLIVGWNVLLFVEYRFDLATAQRAPTWSDLTIRRVTFLADAVRRIWQ